MLFGIPEMKEFAEKSNDPRITALYKRMETSRSLAAKWADAHAKLEAENKKLQSRVEELESVKHPDKEADDSQMEYLRKRFCDVVPGLTSKSWEDIWERVRERFKNE